MVSDTYDCCWDGKSQQEDDRGHQDNLGLTAALEASPNLQEILKI